MPAQAPDPARRAVEIAMAEPRGPVYLTLPREVLAGSVTDPDSPSPAEIAPAIASPPPSSALPGG